MIARSAPTSTLRNILDRVGLASMQLAFYREGGIRLNLWQRTLRHSATGRRRCRPSLGGARFFCSTDRSGPSASAGIARRIPRTWSLTNSGRVGMPKYAAAGNAGGRT